MDSVFRDLTLRIASPLQDHLHRTSDPNNIVQMDLWIQMDFPEFFGVIYNDLLEVDPTLLSERHKALRDSVREVL